MMCLTTCCYDLMFSYPTNRHLAPNAKESRRGNLRHANPNMLDRQEYA